MIAESQAKDKHKPLEQDKRSLFRTATLKVLWKDRYQILQL